MRMSRAQEDNGEEFGVQCENANTEEVLEDELGTRESKSPTREERLRIEERPSDQRQSHAISKQNSRDPLETTVSDEQMVRLAATLRESHRQGSLSDQKFKQLHSRFTGKDASGQIWTVELRSHDWNRKAEGKWVASHEHPAHLTISAATLSELEQLENNAPNAHD